MLATGTRYFLILLESLQIVVNCNIHQQNEVKLLQSATSAIVARNCACRTVFIAPCMTQYSVSVLYCSGLPSSVSVTLALSTIQANSAWPSSVVIWHSGSTLVWINKINLHWAQLVLGWVTVSGMNSWCLTFISLCDQPPRSTHPGHPFVSRCNEHCAILSLHTCHIWAL